VKTEFKANGMYDQCGILLYQDTENWMKASVEAENETISRLGSVVTNLGYSDWATTDIPAETTEVWYRFSRKGQDFYVEYSFDGEQFQQMRMFHIHKPIVGAQVGVYACSPLISSFEAKFSEFKLGPSEWPDYELK
jgi:regulation of enolase protein 1 (concanavalin A-like superfamily)